jgi:hypothetical protein
MCKDTVTDVCAKTQHACICTLQGQPCTWMQAFDHAIHHKPRFKQLLSTQEKRQRHVVVQLTRHREAIVPRQRNGTWSNPALAEQLIRSVSALNPRLGRTIKVDAREARHSWEPLYMGTACVASVQLQRQVT